MNDTRHILFSALRRLMIEQEGAVASEYAVILGVIVVAVVAAAAMFGLQFASTTSTVSSGLSYGTDSAGSGMSLGNYRSQINVPIP